MVSNDTVKCLNILDYWKQKACQTASIRHRVELSGPDLVRGTNADELMKQAWPAASHAMEEQERTVNKFGK
jgi:hypothetical protein